MREAHKSQDIAACDAATEKLNTAWNNASQEMYAAQQQAQPDAGAGATDNNEQTTANKTDDVEFEEVK